VVARAGSRTIGPGDYHRIAADHHHCAAAGAAAVISNSLIAAFSPGLGAIRSTGGIHGMLEARTVIFTDSGGFQASPTSSFVVRHTTEGIHFTARWAQLQLFLTPEASMVLQQDLGSDVALSLDDMAPYGSGRQRLAEALDRTHRWAEACLTHHTDRTQLLFGICQGGLETDLRRESASFIDSLGFDGIAIGGVALDIKETLEQKCAVVETTVACLGDRRPRYVMGIADPLEILQMVALGVDCFDAAYPTIKAAQGLLLTGSGVHPASAVDSYNVERPIDAACECEVCGKYSLEHLRHLERVEPDSALELRSRHNVFFMMQFMARVRDAIRERRFELFASEFAARWIGARRAAPTGRLSTRRAQ
jgi:queuine tRNA-ribosyltransferase